jgi:hypothetical protein
MPPPEVYIHAFDDPADDGEALVIVLQVVGEVDVELGGACVRGDHGVADGAAEVAAVLRVGGDGAGAPDGRDGDSRDEHRDTSAL